MSGVRYSVAAASNSTAVPIAEAIRIAAIFNALRIGLYLLARLVESALFVEVFKAVWIKERRGDVERG